MVVILVYDVALQSSFDQLPFWIENIKPKLMKGMYIYYYYVYDFYLFIFEITKLFSVCLFVGYLLFIYYSHFVLIVFFILFIYYYHKKLNIIIIH